jgi:hypothetical protein
LNPGLCPSFPPPPKKKKKKNNNNKTKSKTKKTVTGETKTILLAP